MITVIQERENIFTVTLDVVELSLVRQIATGFSMPVCQAVCTVMHKGLDSTVSILNEIAEHEQRKRDTNLGGGCPSLNGAAEHD